ncbi:hypothetical protein D3C81_1605280 [compost metagenome]
MCGYLFHTHAQAYLLPVMRIVHVCLIAAIEKSMNASYKSGEWRTCFRKGLAAYHAKMAATSVSMACHLFLIPHHYRCNTSWGVSCDLLFYRRVPMDCACQRRSSQAQHQAACWLGLSETRVPGAFHDFERSSREPEVDKLAFR